MSTPELLELADGLVALHRLGESVDDRQVLDTVNSLLVHTECKPARIRRVVKLIKTFDLKIARV